MPIQIRVLLFIVSIPFVFLLGTQVFAWYLEGLAAGIDLFALIFGGLGTYALFLAITGKKPSFMRE